MRKLPLLLLFIIAVAAAQGAALAVHATTTTVPLEDTGKYLAPGHVYSIDLILDWKRFVGIGVADSSTVSAGPIEIKAEPYFPFGHIGYRLTVIVNGEEKWHWSEEWGMGWGTKEYVFQIDIDCDGQGKIIFKGQKVAEFTLDQATPIYTTGEGKVDIHTDEDYTCNSNSPGGQSGNYPLPPAPHSDDNILDSIVNAFGKAANIALLIVFLGIAGLILFIVFSQARRRGLVTVR